MASTAVKRRKEGEWRKALRQTSTRAAQIGGALVFFAATAFLAIALITYHQTDPSASTAAGGPVENWMGTAGAWVADFALMLVGPACVLFLPLLYVFGRGLWTGPTEEGGLWPRWRPVGLLLVAIVLLATVGALLVDGRGSVLPASGGGIAGLLGARGIEALAGLAPEAFSGWIMGGLGLVALGIGATIVTRLFAIDWSPVFKVPGFLHRKTREISARFDTDDDAEFRPTRRIEAADDDDASAAPDRPARKPPRIEDAAAPRERAKAPAKKPQRDLFDSYNLPEAALLADPPSERVEKLDKLALERNARLLETVLDDFNVKGEISAVRTGPVVTMYELEPAPGIKASRVIGLADDIARNMSAISARVSPIPGRTVMGIELPNAERQMVMLKELIEDPAFAEHKGRLPIILGKDISGEPIVADLAAMPHLLVAGTTGSGKSVGLNAILLSLLYRFTPEECRLILIDPKVLELKSYDDIPHLLAPVVTEPQKAVRSLKWAVEEMERRYRMMSELSVRNLKGFNDKVRAAKAKGAPLGRRVQIGFDPETGEEMYEEQQLDYEEAPQVVVIVDELADLMVTVGKEVEVLIQRLSQKSRAAGIHLIMATQRPSVDVITGVIKANLPTRISFHVTSRIDSRTILGEQGAEQLLGKGDMLYKPNTEPITRVHGPFVSDEEVESVADHWRQQGKPDYVTAVTEEPEDGGFGFDDDVTASDDPKERQYRQVCQMVFENQKASASWIQRQMGVGYNTAAKWIERMEEEGLVGPANHVGRREIYRDEMGNPL